MADSGNAGINKLAMVLQERTKKLGTSPLLLEFGTIQDDYSLLTDTYPIPILKADYLVCRQLTLGATDEQLTKTATDGLHDHGPSGGHPQYEGSGIHSHTSEGAHSHSVLIPEKMRALLPGDRVLVAWVLNDAVVIDIIISADSL